MTKAEKAVRIFEQKLLSSVVSPYIVKIVLFGSWLKKSARKDSDLDVLVVSSNDKAVRDEVAKIAFYLQTEEGVPIEPIVENLEEIFHPSYFLYNILSYGKEVYSMNKDEIKRDAGSNLIRLAEEYLRGAGEACQNSYYRLAVDAGYNAAELAIKALILHKADDLPGSHGGVVGKFGELYVKTKEIEADLGRKINLSLELRNRARYKYQAVIKEEDANSVLELAQLMIDKASSYLQTG